MSRWKCIILFGLEFFRVNIILCYKFDEYMIGGRDSSVWYCFFGYNF